MKKKIIISFALIIVLLCFLANFLSRKNTSINKPTPIAVEVRTVIQKNVPIYIKAFGSFASSHDVNVCPMVSGKIEKIFFQNGSHVKKEQKLFQIDSRPYKAKLLCDEALLKKEIADYNLKKITLKRNSKLVTDKAIPQADYDKAFAEYSMADAMIKSTEADIIRDNINLQYCTLSSHIDGIIGLNKIDEGNTVNTNSTLANIKAIDPLYLNFSVSERDIARIKNSIDTGPLLLAAYVDERTNDGIIQQQKYKGKLKYLNNTANSSSGTISLQAIVPNKDGTIMPGQFARIKIVVGDKENALLVPKEAVREGPNGQYVFIVDNENKAKMINITTASQDYGSFYLLVSGKIKAKDKVIVTGLLDLSSGKSITIEQES